MDHFWQLYGEAAKTAFGFFWKAGWAFILGYLVSAMIQAFVPKKKLTRHMGEVNLESVAISTIFGAASSSCSFAALSAARSLVQKGAHFITAVAFMFASTNLVIELGILILIFLGWQFLAGEIVGGLLLIGISSFLIHLTYPKTWLQDAREKVEEEAPDEEEDFDWLERLKSREGWQLVGHQFVMEWQMVWEEILIGFTIAGFMAVFVPQSWWAKIFLVEAGDTLPNWLILLENAAVAPFVAALTFIGSMGNIPLATVLNANGVFFAGIMGFIYSDLMVPPLVRINAKYYGWRVALYIATVMYVSIVLTAVILDLFFSWLGMLPESTRSIQDAAQFAVDYTLWMNILFVAIAMGLIALHRQYVAGKSTHQHKEGKTLTLKRAIVYLFIAVLTGGVIAFAIYRIPL
ncbi:MAG: permease [Desulforhopalus sp.]